MLCCSATILISLACALGPSGTGVVVEGAQAAVQDVALPADPPVVRDESVQAFENAYGKIIREIRLIGLNRTKEFVVLRELGSKVGEPFTAENARKDPDRLAQLGIFGTIDLRPIVDENDEVILELHLTETFPYLPRLSLEVSDADGVSAGVGFTALNLFGRGIRLDASVRGGGATTFEVVSEAPWVWGDRYGYEIEIFSRDRFNQIWEFDEDSFELNLRMGKRIKEHFRAGLLFSYVSLTSDQPNITIEAGNSDRVPTLGFYVGLNTLDSWFDPRRGWQGELQVSKSGGPLGGITDFSSYLIDVRRYQPVVDRHQIVVFSLTTLRTGVPDETFPKWLAFEIGGANTVRGWSFASLVGKSQFINTAEYRYTLMKTRFFPMFGLNINLGVLAAAFVDSGITWNKGEEFKSSNFLTGYGVGVRFLVPFVDMIRFDVGWGEENGGAAFTVGVRAKPFMSRRRVR
jgi:outer membrane protein insertion porin family